MYSPHTPNQLQNLLSKIQDAVKLHTVIEEKEKTNTANLDKSQALAKDKGYEFYAEHDEASGSWCTFGSETGFAYGSFSDEEPAKKLAGEMNQKYGKKGTTEAKVTEKDKVNKLDLKKAPKVKDKDSEVKPHEQDNPVDDEEHRCATDDMGMQNPDKMPKDKDREDVVVQLESKEDDLADEKDRLARQLHGKTSFFDLYAWQKQEVEDKLKASTKAGTNETATGMKETGVGDEDIDRLVSMLDSFEGHPPRKEFRKILDQLVQKYGSTQNLLKQLMNVDVAWQSGDLDIIRTELGKSKTNETATGRDPEGFVRFATAEEAFLWEDEILGQLSDGAWENATPNDHWMAWGRADIKVGSPAGYYGFRPKRTSYGLTSLIKDIGERMQTHLGLMRMLKAKGVDPEEFVHDQLPDDVESLRNAPKYAKQEGKAGYWSNIIQKWQAWGIDEAMIQKALKDTSEADVKNVLRDIQKTIKVQLPDAGPEPEKEPELKKEEPKVTGPELKTPRGEPGAKKLPAFSKEGKMPAKPAEADEVVTTKALKEDEADYPSEKPVTKMGPIISSDIKDDAAGKITAEEGEAIGELLTDTNQKLEAVFKEIVERAKEIYGPGWEFRGPGFLSNLEKMVNGKVFNFKKMYKSRVKMLPPTDAMKKSVEGKAPISTDTPEQAKKKLMEEAPEGVDAEQLTMGIKVEMEHTDKPEEAKKIALDHLAEDPQYYTKLKKMEAGKCDDVQVEEGAGSAGEQYNITDKDLTVLKQARDSGKIQDEYPSEEDMIDQLASLEGIVDPNTVEEGDVKILWLKYVLIPKAYALMNTRAPSIPSAKSLDKQWSSPPYPHKNEAVVVGPTIESELLMKEVLAAMKKYKWNYEEAVKGFAAKNDMDPVELEHLLQKAITQGRSPDQSVKEQEEVQYVSVADGIVDKKTADDLAVKIKGTVATDDNDPKKFKVITRKDSGTV